MLLHCTVCQMGFNHKSQLKNHLLIHTDLKPFACSQCGKAFNKKSNLKRHLMSHKVVADTKRERRFSCTQCEKAFHNTFLLKLHYRTHTGERPFTCPHCEKRFSQKGNFQRHQKIHEDPRSEQKKCLSNTDIKASNSLKLLNHQISLEEVIFCCPECDQCFSQEAQLKNHQMSHNRPFASSECKSSNETLQLKQELSILSEDYPFPSTDPSDEQCLIDPCDEQCIIDPTYQERPLKTHTKPYSCTECKKRFLSTSDLQRHQSVHTGAKPYICPQCDKSFTQVGHLKRHQSTHTRKKLFSCSSCKKRFNRKESFQIHQRLHEAGTTKMPKQSCFSCAQCWQGFSIREDLLCHQKVHTKCHICTVCKKSFALWSYLLKHKKIHTRPRQQVIRKSERERGVAEDLHCTSAQNVKEDIAREIGDQDECVQRDLGSNLHRRKQRCSLQTILPTKVYTPSDPPTTSEVLEVPAVIFIAD
ncbi:gastrula zinc finger protein XlCGF57.1-like [Ambystoma mexicanum]|uniref:gastrula zinc finger protein XlCGF57.1-like n=1 Tax=Ambystoma mexicanum TaxID=8296 RepID=UPI0037E8FB90